MKTHKKRSNKVCIFGFAWHWKEAPFKDESIEMWSLNEAYLFEPPRLDVLFELHDRLHVESAFRNTQHVEWLKKSKIPVYMFKEYEDIPMSIAYPWEEIIGNYGDYLTNGISEMLCLAMHMKYEEIYLYGVNMSLMQGFGAEYAAQKASCEFWLGWIRGAGIKLYIPRQSDLLKSPFIYGFQGSERWPQMMGRFYSEREAARIEAEKKEKEAFGLRKYNEGAIAMLQKIKSYEVTE
jgi:hypothetical protein